MPVATFDTLKFANTLKAAGVPPQQAEAQAVAFAEVFQLNFKDLATKDDLKATESAIRAELGQLAKDVRKEVADLGKDIRQEVADLGKDIRQEVADLGKGIRQEVADLGKGIRQEVADLDQSLRQEVKDVDQRLGARIDLLAAEIKMVRTELKGEMLLLKWMFGAGVTLALTMFGIVLRLLLVRLPG